MSTEAITETLQCIGESLRTQDNHCTAEPMFCVQILRAETGFDPRYIADQRCWWNPQECETIFDTPPEGWDEDGADDQNGWEMFGYQTHWETVMVAFTQKGCEEYLEQNGHNDRGRAHKGEVRIYVESFYRCPEMIAIRRYLMSLPAPQAILQQQSK